MREEHTIERELITAAMALFMRNGIRSMTMDALAREMGVSKKTLYKFVANRNEMVLKCLDFFLESILQEVEALSSQAENAVEELVLIDRMMSARLCNIQANLFFDLEHYYPAGYAQIMQKRKELMVGQTQANIRRGQGEGLFRKGINPAYIAEFHYSTMLWITAPDLIGQPGYSISDVLREALFYHVHGMATAKGVQLLNQYLPHE